jgi:hypothetical protein
MDVQVANATESYVIWYVTVHRVMFDTKLQRNEVRSHYILNLQTNCYSN